MTECGNRPTMCNEHVLFRYRLKDMNVDLIELVFLTSIFYDEPTMASTFLFIGSIFYDEQAIVFTLPFLAVLIF